MWIYWVLFLWPAIAAIAFAETRGSAVAMKWPMLSLAIVLTLVIGLRFEVGVDWSNYLDHLENSIDLTGLEAIERGEPAYWGLNWMTANAGAGIWVINLICAAAFVSGLFTFCSRLPNTWLALSVAMPYMAIVMAMNYTRQGAAFGLVLWALLALHDGRMLRFVAFIVLATLFHKSAAILMPLGAAVSIRNRWWTLAWVGIVSLAAYYLFIAESQETIVESYLAEQMASDGAVIRVIMNVVPAVVFLLTRHRFDMVPAERQFWTWMSFLVLLFIPALWISPSSTAVDRFGLYFMPIQLMGYSRLSAPDATGWGRQVTTLLVVVAYGIVQYVWFNYSNFYFAWLPYKFYPLEVI